jgi:hypothetical protein
MDSRSVAIQPPFVEADGSRSVLRRSLPAAPIRAARYLAGSEGQVRVHHPDPGVHDADPSVHDADPGVHVPPI